LDPINHFLVFLHLNIYIFSFLTGMMGLTTGRRTTPSPPTYNMSPLIMQSPISQARLVSPYLRGQMMEMLGRSLYLMNTFNS